MIEQSDLEVSKYRMKKAKDLLKQAQQQFDNAAKLIEEVEQKRELLIQNVIPLPTIR